MCSRIHHTLHLRACCTHIAVHIAFSFVADTSRTLGVHSAMLSASTNHILARRLPATAGSLPNSSAGKHRCRSTRQGSTVLSRQRQQDAQVHLSGRPCRGRNARENSISCSAQEGDSFIEGFEPESKSPPYAILLALAAGGIAETSYLTLVPYPRPCVAPYQTNVSARSCFVSISQLVCRAYWLYHSL